MIAGHDWGGLLVWIMARQYPERIAGVIGVNTPDLPRPSGPPVQILRARTLDRPFYLVQFQDRGVAEWVFSWGGRAYDDFVDVMFRGPATVVADAFPPEVLEVYKRAFAATARSRRRSSTTATWIATGSSPPAIADRTIDVPCLMISADGDGVLTPAMADGMEARVPNLEKIVIEHCGHWTQQEHPQETTAAMLAYLRRLDRW